MRPFQRNDRIVCVDATPIPIDAPGSCLSDFSYPSGYIEEGKVYCIERAYQTRRGNIGLILTGLPLFLKGKNSGWDQQRFRKLSSQSHSSHLVSTKSISAVKPQPVFSGGSNRLPPSLSHPSR